jgi:uncharacterized protein (DUF2235 family)
MKRLVICTDGTWNSRDRAKKDGGGLTNVAKLSACVADADASGVQQPQAYIPGVGTGPWWDRIVGGAFGVGVSQNIRKAYRWIIHNYEPGDDLYFFGFSRGAFTARSLVGLIRNCGILRDDARGRIEAAYAFYRNRDPATHPRTLVAQEFRDRNSHPGIPSIKCVGVWDTVGSLGVPTTGPLGWYTRRRYGFHDVALSSWVQNAFHALAVDEHRKPFKPTLWETTDEEAKKPGRTQRVEQFWFSGVHSNVGGGYANSELSDLSLRWMLDRARECGLALTPDADGYAGDCLGELHDSMSLFYLPFGPYLRPVRQPRYDKTGAKLHTFEFVSPTCFERRRTHKPPTHSQLYEPKNLLHIREQERVHA